MVLAAEALRQRGEPIPAFYSRVHTGGAYPVGSDGVQSIYYPTKVDDFQLISADDTFLSTDTDDGVHLSWKDLTRSVSADDTAPYLKNPEAVVRNGSSFGTQRSQTGKGPIAMFWEPGSPFPGQDHRYVAVFRTPPDRFVRTDGDGNVVLDGPGMENWFWGKKGVYDALTGDTDHKWSAPAVLQTMHRQAGETSAGGAQPTQVRIVYKPSQSRSPFGTLPRVDWTQVKYSSAKDEFTYTNRDDLGKDVDPKVVPSYVQDGLNATDTYTRFLLEKEYYTPLELAQRYGLDGLQPPKEGQRPDWRIGITSRKRLNTGGGLRIVGALPVGSPTLSSRSFGIGLRSRPSHIVHGAQFSLNQKSIAPLRSALEQELSLAVRPDEWRQTTLAQWGLLPGSNWTIMTVFATKLIETARASFFETADPGWTVNVHSARLRGVLQDDSQSNDVLGVPRLPANIEDAPHGHGFILEVDFTLQVVADPVTLADGVTDFFGIDNKHARNGHVVLRSAIPFDRVMQDIRLAPYLPGLTSLLNAWLHTKGIPTIDVGGEPITFTPGGERRQQVLLKDSVIKDDVVPSEFTQQFNATASGSTLRLQMVVRPLADGSMPDLEAFVGNPTVEAIRHMVEKGYIDPTEHKDNPAADEVKFFIPPNGHNFHQTAIPSKPLNTQITDLAGNTYIVPDPSTCNLWLIFNDQWALPGNRRWNPERALSRLVYRGKQNVNDVAPLNQSRLVPSPHSMATPASILDGFFGADRSLANPSYRYTAVFGLPYLRYGPAAWNAELRFQRATEAPKTAPAVSKGEMTVYPLSADFTESVDVPAWFVLIIDQVVQNGPTPIIPVGGTAQIKAFLTALETRYPAQSAAVAEFRRRFMPVENPVIADAKFLRRGDATGMLELLPGLGMEPYGGPSTLGGDDNDGGGPLSLSAAYHPAEPFDPGQEASYLRLPPALRIQSNAFRAYDTAAMHDSVARWNLKELKATLAEAGVSPETARSLIVQLGEGVENRVVRLEPFNENAATELFPLLGDGIAYSPEYLAHGPEGMSRKWVEEIAEGTRYAYVIYPAFGSRLPHEPLGMISLHKDKLINDSYVQTVQAGEYPGRLPAGKMPESQLLALGEVWQSSTYLVQSTTAHPVDTASNNPYPRGMVNKASRIVVMLALAQAEVRLGERIEAFYARVHAGPNKVNIPSLRTQESLCGEGPIAVVLENESPNPGETSRYVAIFRTAVERYVRFDEGADPVIDGEGASTWRPQLLSGIGDDTNSGQWLGSELALADVTPASVKWPSAWHRTRRLETQAGFIDGNLLYSSAARLEIPTIAVSIADAEHFSAFGRTMTPHEFLLHDETHRNWLGNGVGNPLVLDIGDPSPAGIALAQRLADISGIEIIVPMVGAPSQWQILRPIHAQQPMAGAVELSADGNLVLVLGTERRVIRPEEHLGQLLGAGVSKTAFRLYDKVLVVYRTDSSAQIVNANNPIDNQIGATGMLLGWGAPYTAPIHGRTTVYGLDAILMDYYAAHSIEAAHETPSGDMVYSTDVSLINENSLSSLRDMREFYYRMGIGVDDPQLISDSNGYFYMHDVSRVLPSNVETLREIDRWIELVEFVIHRRQNL